MDHRKLLFAALAVALGSAACKVDPKQGGELPEVDVRGGQLPKFDIDPAKVEIGTDTHTVVVPKVEVTRRKDNSP